MSLTNEITVDQFERFKSMSIDEIAMNEMGELTTESVNLACKWFNRCRAVENKIGSENRARNFESLKREPRWISDAIEKA